MNFWRALCSSRGYHAILGLSMRNTRPVRFQPVQNLSHTRARARTHTYTHIYTQGQPTPTEEECEQFIAAFDDNLDGAIDKDEFSSETTKNVH